MNSTMAASDLSGALLPQAWAGSLPGVSLALLALAISIWFFQASDDWAKLPGPPPASKLLGHLPQVRAIALPGSFVVRPAQPACRSRCAGTLAACSYRRCLPACWRCPARR